MSFGKRGIVPSSNIPAPQSSWKDYFIKLPSKRLNLFIEREPVIALSATGRGPYGIIYPLSCLALGIVLGGSIGAALTPQLLHAESAGVYDFIHMNDAVMHQRAARPAVAARPRSRLPRLSFRRLRGKANLIQARLIPERFRPERHHGTMHTLAVAKPAPEIGPASPKCLNCEVARRGSPLDAILHDKTLRAGDTVMMSFGAMVFRGAGRPPYAASDFIDFRQTRLLTTKERKLIDADLGLTLRAELLQKFEAKLRPTLPSPVIAKAMR